MTELDKVKGKPQPDSGKYLQIFEDDFVKNAILQGPAAVAQALKLAQTASHSLSSELARLVTQLHEDLLRNAERISSIPLSLEEDKNRLESLLLVIERQEMALRVRKQQVEGPLEEWSRWLEVQSRLAKAMEIVSTSESATFEALQQALGPTLFGMVKEVVGGQDALECALKS